jgi:hypothetical protein
MTIQGCVVGALACQRDSYLQTIDTVVVSCVELSPQKSDETVNDYITKSSSKVSKTELSSTPLKLWEIEFADSVLFPEGMHALISFDFVMVLLIYLQVAANRRTMALFPR